eukprot:7088358-Prymnesium_polylepis.1
MQRGSAGHTDGGQTARTAAGSGRECTVGGGRRQRTGINSWYKQLFRGRLCALRCFLYPARRVAFACVCLLYTSDAADDM